MLIISDTESWSSSSPTKRLSNKLAWLKKNDTPTIIAIGAPHQWHSTLPLPSNATVTDLVDASVCDATLAAMFWPEFLRYVYRTSQPSLINRVLFSLPFQKIPVQVTISDKERRAKVLAAIFNNRSSQFRRVDF
jgi:hypothetical protein